VRAPSLKTAIKFSRSATITFKVTSYILTRFITELFEWASLTLKCYWQFLCTCTSCLR
jgi:hypothetical protein